MKPGDCFIDTYYEPGIVAIEVISKQPYSNHAYNCIVVYTYSPKRTSLGAIVTRKDDDEELVPATLVHIDDKVIPIKL